MRRAWQDELEGHILDCAADQGIDLAEARKRFGDIGAIGQQLSAIHPWLAAYADWIVLVVILLASAPLYFSAMVWANTIPGFLAERLLVWWWGVMIALAGFVLLKWQAEMVMPNTKTLLLYALSTGFVFSLVITAVLDVNNFETTVYNAIFSLISGVALWLSWPKLQLKQKQLLLYSAVGLMLLFAWREKGWLEAVLFPNCLYLQPDPYTVAPKECTQVSWLHPWLLVIYATGLASTALLTHYCLRLWRQSSVLYRKVITTGAFVLLPITPLVLSGVNQSGKLDALPWKRDVYTAYVDILGRRPEQKDYDFYAQTRSYQHLSTVRAVLYKSAERRLKIQLLFQEILLREPTPEELNTYAESTLTIKEIYDELIIH